MSKTVEPPLPTALDSHPADPTAGISADIAPQFRHHAAPHACTTANLPVPPPTSSHVVSGTEVVLGRPTTRRTSSPRNRHPGFFGPNRDHLAERSKYGE